MESLIKYQSALLRQNKEYMLVAGKHKDGTLQFEVQKQGLLLLRQFRNKRLRIVLNVTHFKDDLEQFNACFLGQPQPSTTTTPPNNICELRISNYYQQLSDNRVIIFLNAFEDPNNTNLLVIGYLVASVFFYHNHEQLSQQSQLTRMLAKLRKQLEGTQVDKLQQEIKYKSGCCKKPYLMCLFDQHINKQSCHEQFRQFYKYQEDKNNLNQSVDTLIDYFPERSAMSIANDKERQNKVKKLGEEYLKTILGRQIFNFQITGWTLQNLCFELCEVFNNKTGSINLVSIYNKIINNQKTQVFDYSTQKFTKLTAELTQNLPYQPVQLQQAYARIQKYIVQESIADACNCMIFTEYQVIYKNLLNIMDKKYKLIKDKNKELLRDRTVSCYEKIEEDQALQQQIQNINWENAIDLLELISEKINMFVEENVHQFNTKDMLSRLINKYVELYGQNLRIHLDDRNRNEKNLLDKLSQIETDNKSYQIKCKELENQYIYLNSLNNQFKQKLLNSNPNQYGPTGEFQNQALDNMIFNELNSKILSLEAELNEKNQVIQNLTEVIDKFDIEFNRKYYKPKFSKDIQNILSEITHKMNDIYSLFNDLKKTEKYYQDIDHEFAMKKQQIDKIRQKEKFQLEEIKEKMNQVAKEKECVEKISQQARNAIQTLQSVEIQYKNIVNELENSFSRLKCLQAETQGDFQKYKKALELTISCCLTGKVDKLRDFYKVSTEEDLKEMLRPIVKK